MKSAIVNLSLPAALLRRIDQEARAELRTRSELLREAARSYLEREHRWKALEQYAGRRARVSGIRTESDVLRAIAAARKTR